jgi:thioredoxin 1
MSNVIEFTKLAPLLSFIRQQKSTIVDFAAESWCVPCQQFKPHFDAVSTLHPDVGFVHVDVDSADVDLLAHFSIQSVPMVLWFNGSFLVGAIESRTAPALAREIQLLTTPAEVV